MSIENYLHHKEEWKSENFEINSKDIYANISNIVFKLKLDVSVKQTIILFSNVPEHLHNNLHGSLYSLGVSQTQQSPWVYSDEKIFLQLKNYEKLDLEVGKYVLLIRTFATNSMKGSVFNLKLFHKQEVQMEQIPLTFNQVFVDEVQPSKRHQILKEILYFKGSSLNLNFKFFLFHPAEESDPKKKAKGFNVDLIQPFRGNLFFEVKIVHAQVEILKKTGRDMILVENAILEKNGEDKFYLSVSVLQGFEERAKELNMEKLNWCLSLNADENVFLLKNTEFEDQVKSMVKGWEDKQPGRALKAKKVRELYELKKKQQTTQLTEEEDKHMANLLEELNSNQAQDPKKNVKKKEEVPQLPQDSLFDREIESLKRNDCNNDFLE